jgi:hypothetical protein
MFSILYSCRFCCCSVSCLLLLLLLLIMQLLQPHMQVIVSLHALLLVQLIMQHQSSACMLCVMQQIRQPCRKARQRF